MTASRQDLVHEALKNLGALPEGTTPNAEDYSAVEDRIAGVLAGLEFEDLVFIEDAGDTGSPSSGQIPDHLLLPLAAILAEACASKFGAQDDVGLTAQATIARARIASMESEPYDGSINQATYY